jgi:DNA-binding beta-propeller fold protein YncE
MLLGACGSAGSPATSARTTAAAATSTTASAAAAASSSSSTTTTTTTTTTNIPAATLLQWPEFGLNPQRSDVSLQATGITAANVRHLRRLSVALPGTVDSSPVYVHGVLVAGAMHDVVVVTTTYGRTLAIDAQDGRILWVFTPRGYSSWAGSTQITTASPLVDPDGGWVYATSPNGEIHKLSLANGSEDKSGAWPVTVTRDPTHEKLGAALNVEGPDVLVATSGYLGDAPPYQGHVVLIDRASGRVVSVFNTLCAQRRAIITPSSCAASDSAILSRGGAVVEPGGRILIDTGNGPWNGSTNFGDSVLELTFPTLHSRQAFTPVNQEELNRGDIDLGSSAPVLLGENRVLVAGKDGIMRVLDLTRLDGHAPSGGDRGRLGGEVQRLALPGGGELFSAPAVWRQSGRTTVFVAGEHGTAAYALRGGQLRELWHNGQPGTSPVLAGGLLYVYEPEAGGINVYSPDSGQVLVHLAGMPGHWNSPIVVDGHVVEPEGNANDHLQTGTLELFSAR